MGSAHCRELDPVFEQSQETVVGAETLRIVAADVTSV
jgi:hypothetical protein